MKTSVEHGQLNVTYDPKWEAHFAHAEWTYAVVTIRAKLDRSVDKGGGKGKAAPQ